MYTYLKALHIVFMVSWFAGLFYIVRLFIYHAETKDKPKDEAAILAGQYKIMEKRLWYIITWPAMILTSLFGFWMLYLGWDYLNQPFMYAKLGFVAALYVYHMLCHVIFRQLQNDQIKFSSGQLRLWNEVATLLLVAIVFIIITRRFAYQEIIAFVVVALLLMLGIKLYKYIRKQS